MAEKAEENQSVLEWIGASCNTGLRNFCSFTAFTGDVLHAAFGERKQRLRWNDVLQTLNRCGADGICITLIICLLTGIIIGYQS